MSLRKKAATTAVFAYLQFAVAIATGLFLVPLTLRALGARTWGVWLASGEVLAYAGMTDLGMLGVLQWLIADAEGREDRGATAELVSQGIWLGGVVAIVFVVVALVLWRLLPSMLFLGPADRAVVERPLAVAVALTAIGYPLMAYRALLVGMQDAAFVGIASVVSGIVSVGILAAMLLGGYGLYALVVSGSAVSLAMAVVYAARAAAVAPDIVFRFSRPRTAHLRNLAVNGAGVWLGDIGWQTLAASNSILITYIGHPEWVPVYACTAKLATMGMPMTWILPDSGHVGLAQLYGGGPRQYPRVRDVIMLMQRLHLVIAGLVAAGLLAFNPAFVTRWVGAELFAGIPVNTLLAVGVVVQSFTHGMVTSGSITGNRPRIGLLVLANGLVQTPLAIVLGHRMGLTGIALAGLIAALVTSLPGSIALVGTSVALRSTQLLTALVVPWSVRALPLLVAAFAVSLVYQTIGLPGSVAAASAVCLAYIWYLRPFYAQGLPLDQRWAAWLQRLRLLPPPPAAAVVSGRVLDSFDAPV